MAYTTLNASYSSTLTLTAGTYYMSANVDMNSNTLVFDCSGGDIILKRNGDVSFTECATISTTNSDATHKVYYTVKDDDTIGEAITGSSGSPSASGGCLTTTQVNANVTIIWWEIRWANNKQFLYHKPVTTFKLRTFSHITWKNSTYSSVNVIYADIWAAGGVNGYTDYIHFDNTNTISGTAGLLVQLNNPVDNCFIQNANAPDNTVIYKNTFYDTAGTKSFTNIHIEGSSNYGMLVQDITRTVNFINCDAKLAVYTTSGSITAYFKNCLFRSSGNGIVNYNGTNTIHVQNCIFKGCTTAIYETAGTLTVGGIINSIFDSNTAIFYNTTGTATYTGIYNNTSTTGLTSGTGCITANPSFGNYNASAVIDTDFGIYGFSNGYVATAAQYQQTGSDTYNNLSIDETYYSPDGIARLGTDKVNPGVNYKFTSFAQPDIFEILGIPF